MKPKDIKIDILHMKEAIKRIRELDLQLSEIDEISGILMPALRGYQLSAPSYNPGVKLYRGRKLEEKPNLVKEITYPQSQLVRALGRVNRIQQSIFYNAVTNTKQQFSN